MDINEFNDECNKFKSKLNEIFLKHDTQIACVTTIVYLKHIALQQPNPKTVLDYFVNVLQNDITYLTNEKK